MAEIPIEEIMVLAEMTNALDVVEEAIGKYMKERLIPKVVSLAS
jgi:hypothetical protein